MDSNKDLRAWEYEQLLDALDAMEELTNARTRARKYGLDELDDMEFDSRMLDIINELDRRDTEAQADELAAYYKAVLAV